MIQTGAALLALALTVAILTWLSRSKKKQTTNKSTGDLNEDFHPELPKVSMPEEVVVPEAQPLPVEVEEPVVVLEEPVKEKKKAAKKAATKKAKSKDTLKP